MLASISVFTGLIILIASISVNVLQGTQIALIGVGFMLIGIFLELRNIRLTQAD